MSNDISKKNQDNNSKKKLGYQTVKKNDIQLLKDFKKITSFEQV